MQTAQVELSHELSTSQEGETTLTDNALKIQRKIIHKLEF